MFNISLGGGLSQEPLSECSPLSSRWKRDATPLSLSNQQQIGNKSDCGVEGVEKPITSKRDESENVCNTR